MHSIQSRGIDGQPTRQRRQAHRPKTHSITLTAAQLVLLAAGAAGAALGPGWSGPALPPGVPPGTAAQIVLERKELHLANAWHLIDRASAAGSGGGLAKIARLHAHAALGEGPASGFAWLALGWAERLSGRHGPAREALRRSWRWAPQSRTLSLRRIVLAGSYWPDLDPADRNRLVAEMRFANQSHRARFRALLDADTRTRALWRIARGRGLDRHAFPTDRAGHTGETPPTL